MTTPIILLTGSRLQKCLHLHNNRKIRTIKAINGVMLDGGDFLNMRFQKIQPFTP